jgi:hypothetical protein
VIFEKNEFAFQYHKTMDVDNERAIRAIVKTSVKTFAGAFSEKHLSQIDNEDGIINSKIHNVFIAALGSEIQYYSALCRSLDSSLGNMLEAMAISIAEMHYRVSQQVEGVLYDNQTDFIAELLEQYKSNEKRPHLGDYLGITGINNDGAGRKKRHVSDYYLFDESDGMHYLIELKIGGDLDNKKARSEKEALLEQYCILANTLGSEEKIKIYFATAYNRYGEGRPWTQGRVMQFFAKEELLISADFWNMVCKSDNGYDIVLDEYKQCAPLIVDALKDIKDAYLPNYD